MNEKKIKTKANHGPGSRRRPGIECSCCRLPGDTKAMAKKRHWRTVRKRTRQDLKKEIE